MLIKRLKTRLGLLLAALLDFLTRWSGRRAGLALVYHRVGAAESREHHLVAALDAGCSRRSSAT